MEIYCGALSCSRDQEQACPDGDGSEGARGTLSRRRETFDGICCRHDNHRAQIHDPDDQEDRRQTGTAVAAVKAEAHAVSPGRGGVRLQPAPRCLPAAGKVVCHMPRNDAAAPDHVCPGIRIHAIDMVQPPGIAIPPTADIDAHQAIVTAALAAKSSAEMPKKARSDARSETPSRAV
jgi:hypothetical protein